MESVRRKPEYVFRMVEEHYFCPSGSARGLVDHSGWFASIKRPTEHQYSVVVAQQFMNRDDLREFRDFISSVLNEDTK